MNAMKCFVVWEQIKSAKFCTQKFMIFKRKLSSHNKNFSFNFFSLLWLRRALENECRCAKKTLRETEDFVKFFFERGRNFIERENARIWVWFSVYVDIYVFFGFLWIEKHNKLKKFQARWQRMIVNDFINISFCNSFSKNSNFFIQHSLIKNAINHEFYVKNMQLKIPRKILPQRNSFLIMS